MEGLEGVLGVIGAVSVMVLGWRSFKLTREQAKVSEWSALIENMSTVNENLRAEIARLSERIIELEKSNKALITEQIGLKGRLAELEAIVWEEANA